MRSIFILLCVHFAFPVIGQELYEIKRLTINTKDADEFSPAFYKNGIVFTSNRKNDVLINYSDASGILLTDIYFTEVNGNKWSSPSILSSALRSNFHEGPATFTPDGNTIYFTKNISSSKKIGDSFDANNKLGIYTAHATSKEWENITALPFNNSSHNVAHPSINKEGNILYFISDMPGGYGGTDIYLSRWENNKWSEAENLGAKVNTSKNESFPFIHQNGKLYFASEGHNSQGGLDVFVSAFSNDGWSAPVALSAPINTTHDDFSYIIDDKEEYGYFASNRNKSDDIYSIKNLFPSFSGCDSLQQNNYCYIFYETGSVDVDTLPLKYEWSLGDGTKSRQLEAEHCYSDTGTYLVELNVVDTVTNEIFFNQASYEIKIESIEQVFINVPDTVRTGATVSLDGLQTYLPGFSPTQYYWQFGDGAISTGVKTTHVYNSPGNYTIQLGVMDDHQNKRCSYKNITVKDNYIELASRDPKHNAIKNENKNEAPLVFENPKQEEIDENEEKVYKVEIRRSPQQIPLDDKYFEALGPALQPEETFLEDEKLYSYTVGQAKDLTGTYSTFKLVKAKGYNDAKVKTYIENIFSLEDIGNATAEQLENAILRIQNIYFASGKYAIDPNSYPILDQVAEILKNYEVKIQVSAHTDNIGSEELNKNLSAKRATAIVSYLIIEGIDQNKIIAKGYGEERPISSNNTEEGRGLNRRIEFRLLPLTENASLEK